MALPNLRSIFASSRTSEEERQLSRTTFYKFTAFVGACLVISLLAARNSGRDLRGTARGVVGMVSGTPGKLV
ncbi:hypothetical protein CNB03575 [Cryptococcus deneoformans JEC21]|uniref:Uncharacterized protein n=1 Tax=Cryptococcus deneoformans (strain JEC21 / ATCC MYA-565) TaxID=214684 RepID=A0A0S2LI75_CRYD1|nr:hypothetical protein CNB03575 [Cryptococcus neoformans var. neoformans JEC21]ALO60407.1 hypothetical protein CNB03575 [Cryptococcus neoformans var. neoformans JEC21]